MPRKRRELSAGVRREVALRLGAAEDGSSPIACAYCGVEGTIRCYPGRMWTSLGCDPQGVRMEWDHIGPISRGGTDRAENITVACRSCNRRKSDRVHA